MKYLTFFLLILSVSINAYCGTGKDSISVTTYYPSPHGVYKELKLIPSPEKDDIDCTEDKLGLLYYDQKANQVKVCRKDDSLNYSWESVGGFSGDDTYIGKDFCITDDYGEELCLSDVQDLSDQQLLVKGEHTIGSCRRIGGTVVGTDIEGLSQCKFSGSKCPSGWTQYKHYTTSKSRTCTGTKCPGKCTTGSHTFRNYWKSYDCYYRNTLWADVEQCCYKGDDMSSCNYSRTRCLGERIEIGCY